MKRVVKECKVKMFVVFLLLLLLLLSSHQNQFCFLACLCYIFCLLTYSLFCCVSWINGFLSFFFSFLFHTRKKKIIKVFFISKLFRVRAGWKCVWNKIHTGSSGERCTGENSEGKFFFFLLACYKVKDTHFITFISIFILGGLMLACICRWENSSDEASPLHLV